MRVFLSSDIEGSAGISDWDQVRIGEPEFALGRELLAGEVNAAIDGAVDGGAEHVLVNDGHSTMHNLHPGELHHGASYLSGAHKPLYMMEGLDGSYDSVSWSPTTGRSAPSERSSPTRTTLAPSGRSASTAGPSARVPLNALVALHHDVPVVLITGDEATAEEARPFMPEVEAVVVKRSITRFAAESLHPDRARALIQEGARTALERAGRATAPVIDLPATLQITFLTADMAEMATWIRDVERADARTVTVTGSEPLALYRTFTTIVAVTRSLTSG